MGRTTIRRLHPPPLRMSKLSLKPPCETVGAIPTPAPVPTPDIEAIVETVLQQTMDTLLETLFMGLRNYLKI